jgi:hypothetical protein
MFLKRLWIKDCEWFHARIQSLIPSGVRFKGARVGFTSRALGVVVAAICLTATQGAVTTPAFGGTHSDGGWDFSWDDALLISPSDNTESCRKVPIRWVNNTEKRWFSLNVSVTGTDNVPSPVIGSFRIEIAAGASGTFDVQVCKPESFIRPFMVPGGVAQVSVTLGGYPSTSDTPIQTSFSLPFGQPVKIPVVAPQSESCVRDSIDLDDPSLCVGPFYLKLDGAITAFGDSERPLVRLYNKKGPVPITVRHEDFNGILVTPRSFSPGKYLVMTRNYTAGKWSCSLYYQDVCRWSDSNEDIEAYTFTWTGTKITKVKFVPEKKIKMVRL